MSNSKWYHQIDTTTIRWENTGGNCMILSARVWFKEIIEGAAWQRSIGDVEKYWVLAGIDGVGFYDTLDNPLDDCDDIDPVVYYDWEDVNNGLVKVDEKLYDVYLSMTTMYQGYILTNDYCYGIF